MKGVIKFTGDKVTQIISLADNTDRTEYTLEPELISNLFDKNREKRRLVKYEDIPPVLVHAVVSAEDKRFFQHSGFDPIRIIKAAYIDVREHRYAQGASTLSQQLARSFWLDNDKTWRRKIPEVLITMHLEQKLKKEQIFEYYANQVPLGHRGSFGIRGFGEAAQVYFGKDVSKLTLPEAATLAGLIQQPSFTNPFRWPERARQRRNVVLKLMRENDYISDEEYESASASPMDAGQARNGVHRRAVFCRSGERHAARKIPGLQFSIQYVSRVYDAGSEFAARRRRSGADWNGRGGQANQGPEEEGSQLSRSAVRFDCAGPADGRGEGADRREKLRHQPAQSYSGQAAAGLVIQAVCLRGGAEHGTIEQRAR